MKTKRIQWTHEMFIDKVSSIFCDRIEVIGRFTKLSDRILVRDKYGLLSVIAEKLVLGKEPSIQTALNKTEYFMNQMDDVAPNFRSILTPLGEYKHIKAKMLFQHKYGIVSMTPDNLLLGKLPDSRSAVNREDFYTNWLIDMYKGKYTYKFTSGSSRHSIIECTCNKHGTFKSTIGNLLEGYECKDCTPTNTLYLIKLSKGSEECYKIGVSRYNILGTMRRYSNYISLGYSVEEITTRVFESTSLAFSKESEIKRILGDSKYTPNHWKSNSSDECFTGIKKLAEVKDIIFK